MPHRADRARRSQPGHHAAERGSESGGSVADPRYKQSPDDIAYLPYDPSAPATTLFTGAEFRLRPHLTLTPNPVFTRYDRNDQGIRPQSDLHLRLTLLLDFE